MPSSSSNLIPVPIPDRVAGLIGAAMPPEVMDAEGAAVDAAITVSRCRTPFTRKAREYALADLARANKVLAAWDPRLIVKAGAR